MRIHARTHAYRVKVFSAVDGSELRYVIEADDEAGWRREAVLNPNGTVQFDQKAGDFVTREVYEPIRFDFAPAPDPA